MGRKKSLAWRPEADPEDTLETHQPGYLRKCYFFNKLYLLASVVKLAHDF